ESAADQGDDHSEDWPWWQLRVPTFQVSVVFGGIGTSPITIQTAFNPNDPLPVPISTDNVYGVVSLIFGDDHRHRDLRHAGDARPQRRRGQHHGAHHGAAAVRRGRGVVGTARTLAALGLFGAALFFGESMITPAISPRSDRNSLNRAVRAVLAEVGSV